MRYSFHQPPQILVGHPLVCIVIDSMPEIGCRFIYAGLIFSLLSITLHHPNHVSHYCLLSIAAASPIPPKWVPDIAYMSSQMYTLGCCVEKHRCHSCGAHGNGKTLLAQVLPCGMTKTFVKLRSLPETSIFNAASVKRFYISQRRTDKKLPSCMFPPTHKQFGCRSCGSSKVGCLGLPHSVPWWPVALATRHTLLIRRPRYYNGPNQPATTDIAPAIAQVQRVF